MTLTYSQATDEINSLFWQSWNSVKTSSVVGYVPEMRWQNVENPTKLDGSKFWGRFSIQTVMQKQSTLSTCEGAPGQKRYTTEGLLFVQIFCPKSTSRAFELGRSLAEVARNCFRGISTPGKVWFRNARINELAPEDLFYRLNVVAEFEYDEIG